MTYTQKLEAELDTLKGIDESIKAIGGPRTMNDLLALLARINIKLINVTSQPVTFVDKSGNPIVTYKPVQASTQFKITGCSWLVTEETFQSLQLILPSIKIVGQWPLMVAVPKEPVYDGDNNPFTPNKLIGYKRIELHNIDFKK